LRYYFFVEAILLAFKETTNRPVELWLTVPWPSATFFSVTSFDAEFARAIAIDL
jgi:hypothetical protein